MAFDDLTKQIFKNRFGDAIQTDIKVGALEKSFDFHLNGQHPQIQSADIIPELFKAYEHNIVEYKSSHDTYHLYEILKLLGDFAYFSYNSHLDLNTAFNNSCLWFLVVNSKPLIKEYHKIGLKKDTERAGFYFYPNAVPPIRIISINELDPTIKENSLLLILSSGDTFQQFSKYLIGHDPLIKELQKYLIMKLFLEGKEVAETEEVKTLKRKIDFEIEENIRYSVEKWGLEKVINAVGLEKAINAVGLEKAINAVGLEKAINAVGLEKVINTIGLEKLEKMIEKMKRNKKKAQK